MMEARGMFCAGARGTVALALVLALICGRACAQPVPKHGGILEFAVLVEPNDYDCYANTSFAFLHPIAPHYSTLLNFDASRLSEDRRRLGPVLERITRPDDLYLQAAAECFVP